MRYHFYTGFNRYFFETILHKSGFVIEEIVANGNYFELLAQETRRVPEVAKRYCRPVSSIVLRLYLWIMPMFLWFLQQCATNDAGSQELGCHGYHVKAVKKHK